MVLSPSDQYKLTGEEINNLVNDNLVLQQTTAGKRKVSAAFLTPPTTNAPTASGSSSGLSVRHVSGSQAAAGGFFDLPHSLDSAETLEVCGFNTFTANQIFSNFVNKPVDSPDTLVGYAIAHVASINGFSPYIINTPMSQLLTNIGFSNAMKQIFAKPEHDDVVKTQTLHYWVVDTIRGNYHAIEILQARVKDAARNIDANRKQGKKAKVEAPPPPTATISGPSRSSHFPVPHVMVTAAPEPKEGHVYLMKGKSLGEMWHKPGEPALNFIGDNGEVNLSTISSNTGGDWNGSRRKYYFTPDLEIAEKYREWAADRFKHLESWIIHAQVPKTYTDSLKRQDLWWGFDFRWFTWLSRRGEAIKPNSPMRKYDQAELLVGHTARSPFIAGINEARVQTEFNEEDLLFTPGGSKAHQWVFDWECTIPLSQRLRGNIHIDVFDPKVRRSYPTAGFSSS